MHPVKLASRRGRTLLPLMAALALALTACASASARPAPFRGKPDTVNRGDLRGPFDGVVLDAESERPVAGAQIYGVWSFSGGYGFQGPAGKSEFLGRTDAGGRYRVPELDAGDVPGGARVSGFRLVIFKRGYVAWRSDRRFEDFGPRYDFAQRRNAVKLERWRSELSHVRHLRYVGGGATLAELTRWEVPEALAELSGQGPAPGGSVVAGGTPVPSGPPLPANLLLVPADVAEVTGFTGEFDVSDLGDDPPTPQYNSVHLRAKNQPEAFDVAARIWKVENPEPLFDRLVKELPGVKETGEIGDRSLRAVSDAGDIMGFAFLDRSRGLVVLVQCGASQCKNGDQALAIAKHIKERADSVFPLAGAK
jgi:hypothetical protein